MKVDEELEEEEKEWRKGKITMLSQRSSLLALLALAASVTASLVLTNEGWITLPLRTLVMAFRKNSCCGLRLSVNEPIKASLALSS
jgi:hypothetical protein